MPVKNIRIKGEKHTAVAPAESSESLLTLEASFTVGGATRGAVEDHPVTLDNGKMVEFVFDDGTTWLCNADTLEEVFPTASQKSRSAGADVTFEIPTALRGQAAERGFSDVVLKAVNVFAKKAIADKVNETVKKLAADLEKKQLENQSGLYRVDDGFRLQTFEAEPTDKPYLLLLHGTNSSTKGSFAELTQQKHGATTVWAQLKQIYNRNTLAFQHETFTQSPLQNVLKLITLLPASATLHLVSHSRGGLIGDLLSRFCNSNENERGFDKNERAYLKSTGRTDDLDCIAKIEAALSAKRLVVEKFIRVACPANGTILASKRLDNLLNISLNLIGLGAGLAASPVYTAAKNLIAAVVDSKNSLEALPGIEAMNPDSPFIKVLNSPGTNINVDNPLVVISGNCKVSLNLKALLIIASRLFYFTDNDLVVNTLSMYQGAKRHNNVTYLFDEATDVDHFHYFANEKTGTALLAALKSDGDLTAAGFKMQEQGHLAQYGRSVLLNPDGGGLFTQTVTGTKPIAVLLPGIMGSNLSVGGQTVWINYSDFLTGGLEKLAVRPADGIEALSVVAGSYKKLAESLSATYDVFTFPYDWRLSLTQSADRFNADVKKLLSYSQPIKIIAHSTGGVLVRDFIINHGDTWKQLNESKDFRLLFLGAPLGGSFRIPAMLFGQDAVINNLSKIDIRHTKQELLSWFSQMPGLWSLLPLTEDGDNDFANETVWKKMAEATQEKDWQGPQLADADATNWFGAYRKAALDNAAGIDYTNAVYIAGKDKATPCGYRIDILSDGSEELVFLSTAEGDGTVTWESGIPKKLIENKAVYYVNVTHGALAAEPSLFDGIAEILRTGYTARLSKVRPVARAEEKAFRMPEPQAFNLSEEGVTRSLLGLEGPEVVKPATKAAAPLLLSVRNGDLRYASFPVLAGHFAGDGILYAEKQLDESLEHALSVRHRLGIYPGPIGTNTVVYSGKDETKGAIIVGLDSFGSLTSFQLTQTVEQGVSKYLLEINSRQVTKKEAALLPDVTGISAVLIGSGYGGLSIENSARAIVQGVQNANAKIDGVNAGRMKLVEQLQFIELYEDRALSCYYAVGKLAKEADVSLNLSLDKNGLKTFLGAQKRIPAEISEGWWQRISVRLEEDKEAEKKDAKDEAANRVRCLQFTVSTGGAREEKRNVYVSPVGLDTLINESADKNRWSPEVAKTLFELLVPLDFKEQLKKQCNINWIVDEFTAGYPWELLQDKVTDAKPLSINGGMIRQLATGQYRLRINAVTVDQALVIADPDLQGFVGQLPGAEEEGKMMNGLLEQNGFVSTSLIRGRSTEILRKLYSAEYKIIHLAGHGFFNEKDPKSSGMAIGKNEFLSTFHIYQMSTVPELVFVNCCYLGKMQGMAEEYYSNRYKLAANIGTQLIQNGVKAVIAAGWEVSDAAALEFTRLFYQYMFANYNFGTAVQEARKAVYEKYGNGSNTWGAYQAYGDPFYKFRDNLTQKKEYKPVFAIAEEAEMELYNLHNNLKTPQYTPAEQRERLEAISKAVDEAGLRGAVVTELEASIYTDLYEYDKAIEKFAALLKMEEAAFSVASLEKYCNVRMKKYVQDKLAQDKQKGAGNDTAKSEPAPAEVLAKIDDVIADLYYLVRISDTTERNSLLGSAFKRKALLYGDGATAAKKEAYAMAAYYYQKANAIRNNAYGLTNWYELETILMFEDGPQWGETVTPAAGKKYDLPSMAAVKAGVSRLLEGDYLTGHNMNYWELILKPNARLCLLVVELTAGEDEKPWNDVLDEFRSVWERAGTRGDKVAEIEHLALLLDALTLTEKPAAKPLRLGLELVKKGLERMV